ncbi:MAG: pyridoxal phosphate-dependent aminotransferase [Bacteroidota bacterium]
MDFSDRVGRLSSETAFSVLARAKYLESQGKEVIHLEIGQPDFDTPQNIKDAAIRALQEGKTGYCPTPGINELREAIARETAQTRNVKVDPEQVVITPGAKPIMFFTILALVNEGDEVMYPNPGFPIYESLLHFVKAKAIPYPLREEKGFSFDIEEFRSLVTNKTKLIILNSPQNPTGGILPIEDLEAVAKISAERNIAVLSDEIYRRLIYDQPFHSIASVGDMMDRTIILDGFSKTFAMTGWRLGYGVMNVDLAKKIELLQVNSNSCAPTFTQYGGIEALEEDQTAIDEMVAAFRKRREVIVAGLNQIDGLSCITPQGAFYAFPNVKKLNIQPQKLADLLLDQYGVALLNGSSFGQYGTGYLRLSYANSIENINKALDKIQQAITDHKLA